MNIIQESISNVILFQIPREVLQHALYIGRGPKQVDIATLGSKILSLIVKPRVLLDINLASANTKFVDIGDCTISEQDQYGMVITVPSNKIGGGSIVSPVSISSSVEMGIAHTNMELIAENTIYLHDVRNIDPNARLKCTVTYDPNLNNLPPGATKHISRLITDAVKSYCYNELRIRLGKGEIYQGAELTEIRNVIDTYSDAEANYQERQDTILGKLLFMSNESAMSEFTKHHFPR